MTHRTFPKPKKAPKVPNRTTAKARAKRRRASEAVKRDIYALVEDRDGRRCRACNATTAPEFMHHHHIVYRSHGGPHTTVNVVTLCQWCHADVHHRVITISGNADETLTCRESLTGRQWESPCPS